MFDQDSAQPDKPAGGSEIEAETAPQSVTGGEEHDVGAGGGLPWYFANRYAYRNNKSGKGRHLAPQETFVQDVLSEGMALVEGFTFAEDSTEFEQIELYVSSLRDEIVTLDEFDVDDDEAAPIKLEAKAVLRNLRTRFVLALKIAGSNHVDRMYRIRHAQLNDWDINRTTEHNAFIQSGNIRDKWARKAAFYGTCIEKLTDKFSVAEIDLNLEGGIRQSLYQDARDVNQQLTTPKPMLDADDKVDKSALSALAA